ncbi:hypothetical protein FJ967_19635 [Mesorhizobium sp. B2-3-4]|nr:hypothetical protein FJ967_19635 [Mesorhizobium sp. B2-3-4]
MIIRWHQEMGFAHDMPDDEWMEPVGAAQWVVLSQDRKWHEIEVEAQAVRQHGLRCFICPALIDGKHWQALCSATKR